MGGFFGVSSKRDCLADVFYGVDYHSHLGTKRGGLASFDARTGFQRQIHSIENAPFRTRFEHAFSEMSGNAAIGCISDTFPQPLLIRSRLGTYAICMTGVINNAEALADRFLSLGGGHFDAMTGDKINQTELAAALIDQRDDFASGIKFAQRAISGTASILILKSDGSLIAARDRLGRLPVQIGKNEDGMAVAFERFSYEKVGYEHVRELGPGEIVEIAPDGEQQLSPPEKKMRICSFLWTYYGYPTSTYEDSSVEQMRYRNGQIMAENDSKAGFNWDEIDYVGGVPDSGTAHAIGYANKSGKQFARAFIKYTPTWSRSFMPPVQTERDRIAKMKQIPVRQLIKGKKLLFVDDSIVRGTQLKETVEFLYSSGADAVHIRSACPPIMYGCKYLNFSRATGDMDLLARRMIMELEGEEGFNHIAEYSDAGTERGRALREHICKKMHFSSLEFQTVKGAVKAIGLEPCKLCTYCWTGKE